ncbi:hypothetical protein [Corallococcus sp. EGB]|uniref:hypothetical protein n=1 Tax=Corallococcus sp. EGB TaxID=1521117 RepID=UPI001CBEEF74|nr:hypothetical protein [Corallococcus sp. EGB]
MRRTFAALLPLCLLAFGCENPQHAQRATRRDAIREAYQRSLRTAATGFEETRWSMSPDEVRAQYPGAVPVEGGGLEVQSMRWGMPAVIRFSFAQEELAAVTLHLGAPGDLREAYRDLASTLQAQFGAPQEAHDSAAEAAHRQAVASTLTALAFTLETIQAVQERRPPDDAYLAQLNDQAWMGVEGAHRDAWQYTLLTQWHLSATEVRLHGSREGGRQALSLSYASVTARSGSNSEAHPY